MDNHSPNTYLLLADPQATELAGPATKRLQHQHAYPRAHAAPSRPQICIQWLIWLITLPFCWLFNAMFSYRYIYVLSVHSHPSSIQHIDAAHHKIFGVYHTSAAARVACTEVMRLPEYAGRPVTLGFVELEVGEPGALVASIGYGGSGFDKNEDGRVTAVIERMSVRSSGL